MNEQTSPTGNIVVAGFYRFVRIDNLGAWRACLRERLADAGVRGTILLSGEGVNATLAGSRAGIDAAMAAVRQLPGCGDLQAFESRAAEMPFGRLKVRLKREIVSLRDAPCGTRPAGLFADPQAWNALLARDDVVVIDLRNDYETAIGSFKGAINPNLQKFSEFPDWWRAHGDAFAGRPLAMFCTGGIRCEKAVPFLAEQGRGDVIQLGGGILRYLAEVDENSSFWHGACFVFDERIALGHGLVPSGHVLCKPCGRPVEPSADGQVRCVCGMKQLAPA